MFDWKDIADRKSRFMDSIDDYTAASAVIIGAPMDFTASFRPGSRGGPQSIREASYGLEWYSPALDRDLHEISFVDLGDLVLPIGNVSGSLELIRKACNRILGDNKMPFLLGGEHLVSLPAIEAAAERYNDPVLLHFDAHTDLRTEFFGEALSHANVIRLALERGFVSDVHQFGIRSGDKPEFEYAREHTHLHSDVIEPFERLLPSLGNKPVYVTVDIDVLDPAFAPGTGTPEPGGISSGELLKVIRKLRGLNVVGFDLVEIAPVYDHSEATSLVGAKVLREAMLALVK